MNDAIESRTDVSDDVARSATGSDWWSDLDGEILRCLSNAPLMTPLEIGHKLGLSETAVSSALAHLALTGKVRIRVVELVRTPVA